MKILSLAVVPFVAVAIAALASCAGEKKEASGRPAEAHRGFSERINEKAGFVQDSEGKWAPRVNRRSSFETKGESPYFKGEYGKKEYKAGDYAKQSWQGGKSFETKAYQGDTDGSRFAKSSRFDGQAAREGSQGAREGGQTAREGGNAYATGDAREAEGKRLAKPSDAETDSRRKVYTPPEIIDWREQRSLSMEQTKGILGRE